MSTKLREVMVLTKRYVNVCDHCGAEAESGAMLGWHTVYPRDDGVPITALSPNADLCSKACLVAWAEGQP